MTLAMHAIAMGINMPIREPLLLMDVPRDNVPISKPFRLMDLPREVRDGIYGGVLCDWRTGAAFGHILVDGKVRFAPMRHSIETNILLANKQIYQEAKLVLLKGNQFVLIKTVVNDRSIIPALFIPSQVPVVAAGRDCAAVFKGHVVMTHFIDFSKTSTALQLLRRIDRIDLVLLHGDLPQFCKALPVLDMLGSYSVQSKHQVTVHNPFAETLSPDFLSRKNQV